MPRPTKEQMEKLKEQMKSMLVETQGLGAIVIWVTDITPAGLIDLDLLANLPPEIDPISILGSTLMAAQDNRCSQCGKCPPDKRIHQIGFNDPTNNTLH